MTISEDKTKPEMISGDTQKNYGTDFALASTFNIWWIRDAITEILTTITRTKFLADLVFVKNNDGTFNKMLLLYTKKAEVHLGFDVAHYKILSAEDLTLLLASGEALVLDQKAGYAQNYATPMKTFYDANNPELIVQGVQFGVYTAVLTKFMANLVSVSLASASPLTYEDVMHIKEDFMRENYYQSKRQRTVAETTIN